MQARNTLIGIGCFIVIMWLFIFAGIQVNHREEMKNNEETENVIQYINEVMKENNMVIQENLVQNR